MRTSFTVVSTYMQQCSIAYKKYIPLIHKFITFACGALFTRSITLLLAPITMKLLTPQEYGILALANSFISILTALLGCGLRQMLPLHYFHLTTGEQLHLIIDICSIYCLAAIPALIIVSSHLYSINNHLFIGQASYPLLILSMCIAFIYFFVELFYQLLQYQQLALRLTVIQLIISVITICCNFIFLYAHYGPISILIGQAIGMVIICIIGSYICVQHNIFHLINLKRTLRVAKSYLMMSLPFIPSMLCGLLLASGDRWILARLSTMHNVGIYSVANTLAQCANMISFYALTGSYMPYMLNAFAADSSHILLLEQENKRVMWVTMIAMFIMLTCGFASSKSILYWLIPSTFHAAIDYMYMLLLGSIFLLGTYFLNCLLQFKKKSIFLGSVLCFPASLNVILNIILIPYLDLHGCVLATLIAYIIYFLVTYAYNVRILNSL